MARDQGDYELCKGRAATSEMASKLGWRRRMAQFVFRSSLIMQATRDFSATTKARWWFKVLFAVSFFSMQGIE